MKLSDRISTVSPSLTLAIDAKAKEMKAAGIDVISFGCGEPDFATPTPIIHAAKLALDDGLTRYGPVPGSMEVRSAVADDIFLRTDMRYAPDQIILTCGAKSAIFIALQVLLNKDDEAIIPAPYWVSYPDQVALAGGKPVIVETLEENGFKLTVNELKKAITDKTKILFINSPSNPTGAVYSAGELKHLVDLCVQRGITILSDEIYDRLIFNGSFCSVLEAAPEAVGSIVYINGVSKSHAMTGWRAGYAAGPKDLIRAMTTYQSQLLTCIPPFIQKAVVTALTSGSELIADMLHVFSERRELMMSLTREIPGVSFVEPDGAFFLFVNIKSLLGKSLKGVLIKDSLKFSELLLDNSHVAVVPGSAFGMEGYIRLSFATSTEDITEGLKRIKEAVLKCSPPL